MYNQHNIPGMDYPLRKNELPVEHPYSCDKDTLWHERWWDSVKQCDAEASNEIVWDHQFYWLCDDCFNEYQSRGEDE
jgi:hypothetical protein